jgi:hypothetical protein
LKAWIRDNYYMEKIPAKRLRDNALLHIFPVRDDPAEQIPSQRDDGLETILWHGEKYEVFSIDLQWENSSDRITPYEELPPSGFVYALNDYCQDYYKHYEGYPMEFEYEGKVYPFEYFIEYVSEPVTTPIHTIEPTPSGVMAWRIKDKDKAIAMKKDSELQ